MTPSDFTSKHAARFWAKVNKPDADSCWDWQASITHKGYGQFSMPGNRVHQAQRVAYLLHHGIDPADKSVCHTCDNRKCCNPSHLFLGSTKENLADMIAKGRSMTGTRNPRAKLNEDQVRSIRTIYADGGCTYQALAERFGISKVVIERIVQRRLWKHI